VIARRCRELQVGAHEVVEKMVDDDAEVVTVFEPAHAPPTRVYLELQSVDKGVRRIAEKGGSAPNDLQRRGGDHRAY
jgi:hypothetical protein